MEYLNIGSTPAEESCAQVGSEGYEKRARIECRIFAEQLTREFPDGYFRVKSFPHDFGTYYEVCAYYAEADEAAMQAAFDAESDASGYWDEQSEEELRAHGFVVEPLERKRA